jgi:hypothetical protein
MTAKLVGMAWYKSENFKRVRAMYDDGYMLQSTYSDWLATAELGYLHNQSRGFTVVKVDIDPEEFPRWCADQKLRMNAIGRLVYTQFKAEQVAKARSAAES